MTFMSADNARHLTRDSNQPGMAEDRIERAIAQAAIKGLQEVWVDAPPVGFEIAARLRDAGYTVDVYTSLAIIGPRPVQWAIRW